MLISFSLSFTLLFPPTGVVSLCACTSTSCLLLLNLTTWQFPIELFTYLAFAFASALVVLRMWAHPLPFQSHHLTSLQPASQSGRGNTCCVHSPSRLGFSTFRSIFTVCFCWHRLVIWLSCVVRVFESSCYYRYLYWSPYGIMNYWTIFRYLYCLCSTYGLSFVSLYQDTGMSCNSISWRGSAVFYLVSNQ